MDHGGCFVKRLVPLLLIFLLAASVVHAYEPTKVLMFYPRHFGANSCLIRDKFEEFGWHISTLGVTRIVQPCQGFASIFGMPAITVDYLPSEIDDISEFDCLAIVSSERSQPSPCSDITGSQDALNLIANAVNEGLAVGVFCISVRALAAADVLEGVNVQGPPEVQAEVVAAGGIYVGTQLPPVISGNIISCTRGQYFNVQNCEAFARVLDSTRELALKRGEVR